MKSNRKRILNIRKAAGCAVFAAVLLGCMVLAGCKKEDKPAPAAESSSAAAQSTAAAKESLSSAAESTAVPVSETEKKVLLDDDVVQLTLNGAGPFSADAEDNGTTKTANPEVEVSFDVTNKGEEEIVLDLRDLKVGETAVKRILLAGDIVAPGATMTFRYGVLPQEGEADAAEAEPVTWDMASERGVSGTVKVMNIEGEIAQAEFSTK